MVMIVKDPEKKACGLISVTWITVRAHVSALPGPRGGAATVYNRRSPAKLRSARACRCARPACHRGQMTPAAVTAGPMMRNDGVLARSANTQAVPLAAGWSWLTAIHQMKVPGLAVGMGDLRMEGIPAGPL